MIRMTEIAQRVFGEPLLMHEGKLIAALTAVGGRIIEGGVHFAQGIEPIYHVAYENGRPSMGKLGDRLGRAYDRAGVSTFDVIDGVAVLGIEGTLVHKGAHLGMESGRTSYQGLQTQVVRAMRDPNVKAAVFETDSFGGEAAGAFETADLIAKLSAAKPTMAILTDNALSAGYLLASAARQVVMPEMGRVGSIGAVQLHMDLSKKLEQDGVTVTVLSAGKFKADGNPFQALDPAVRARMEAALQAGRTKFAEHVGRYRGKRFTKDAALGTEAGSFYGDEALKLGMVDALAAPSEAFSAFLFEINRTR